MFLAVFHETDAGVHDIGADHAVSVNDVEIVSWRFIEAPIASMAFRFRLTRTCWIWNLSTRTRLSFASRLSTV